MQMSSVHGVSCCKFYKKKSFFHDLKWKTIFDKIKTKRVYFGIPRWNLTLIFRLQWSFTVIKKLFTSPTPPHPRGYMLGKGHYSCCIILIYVQDTQRRTFSSPICCENYQHHWPVGISAFWSSSWSCWESTYGGTVRLYQLVLLHLTMTPWKYQLWDFLLTIKSIISLIAAKMALKGPIFQSQKRWFWYKNAL